MKKRLKSLTIQQWAIAIALLFLISSVFSQFASSAYFRANHRWIEELDKISRIQDSGITAQNYSAMESAVPIGRYVQIMNLIVIGVATVGTFYRKKWIILLTATLGLIWCGTIFVMLVDAGEISKEIENSNIKSVVRSGKYSYLKIEDLTEMSTISDLFVIIMSISVVMFFVELFLVLAWHNQTSRENYAIKIEKDLSNNAEKRYETDNSLDYTKDINFDE